MAIQDISLNIAEIQRRGGFRDHRKGGLRDHRKGGLRGHRRGCHLRTLKNGVKTVTVTILLEGGQPNAQTSSGAGC
jgi:hypothetical protein